MLLAVFVLFGVIAFILVFLGYWTHTSVYALVGFLTLFFISFPLMNGALEVPTGTNSTFTDVNSTMSTFSTTTNYLTLDDILYKRMGFYVIVLSVGGMMAVLLQFLGEERLRKSNMRGED